MEGMLGALSFRCQRWDEAVKWGTAKTDHLPVLQRHGWRRVGVGLAHISRIQDAGQPTSVIISLGSCPLRVTVVNISNIKVLH